MSFSVGPTDLDPPVALAPMAGITDRPFRDLVRSFGAGLVVSEMVASQEMVQAKPGVRERAELSADVENTAVQIAGREAYWMAEAARQVADRGARMIDINMGCPAKKVTNGYSGSGPGPDVDMIYPGDPGFCGGPSSGWSEVSAGNQPFDRRSLQSVGPLTLAPGQKIELDVAMIWARGSDNLNSVCALKSAASNIKTWWEGQPHGCFNIILAEEEPQSIAANIGLYPNPTTGDFTLELGEALKKGGQLAVYDLAGKQVFVQPLAAQQLRYLVPPGNLADGMYFVKIENGKSTMTKRLIVQH